MNGRLKDARGFTLLELLMVVIIIAILAAIALPQYLRTAERTRAAEALQILAALRSSELRYQAAHPGNLFTGTLDELDVAIPGFSGVPASSVWSFSAETAITQNAIALRNLGGAFGGATIEVDLVTGTTCASNAVYGLTVGAAC